jgi:hypothetical protein
MCSIIKAEFRNMNSKHYALKRVTPGKNDLG